MVETQTKNQNVFWLWSNAIDFQKRGDTQYWLPIFLDNEKAVSKFSKLTDLVELKGGATPLGSTYVERGIPFLRIQNIGENELILDEVAYISDDTHEGLLKRSQLKAGDVLFTITGRIGSVAVVPDEMQAGNINQHMVRMRIKDRNKLLPYYLSTYLLTNYAKLQHERVAYGTTRIALDYPTLYNLKVFVPPLEEQQKVEQIVKDAFWLKKEAEAEYQKSQQLLNEALGLTGIEKKRELTFWRWNDEIDIIARIDPDYYRKGYTQLAKAKSIKLEPLSKFVISYSGGYTFETEKYLPSGIPIIRIKDLNYPEVKKPEDAFFADLPELQHFTAKPDDILISMSGTIGLSAIIPKELSKCYVNQRITVITTKGINKFYLLAFLNSSFCREELEKVGTGGVQTNVSYRQIVSLPILRLGDKEEIIGNLLTGFIEKNKESKRKLQEAKDFVESLIKNQNKSINKIRRREK